ncbi:MAG: hypothetical protein HQL47_08820 [Gammaproteobacteria bacterium]|nr:hypothetical protein [Gammaproteobacteria bacterium]
MPNPQTLINLPPGETLQLCGPAKIKQIPPAVALSKSKAAALAPKTSAGLFTGAGPKSGTLAKSATGLGSKLAKGSSSLSKGAAGLSKAAAIPGIASAGVLPLGSLSKLFLGTGGASIGLGSGAFVLTPLLTLAGVGLGAFVIYRRSRAMMLKAESSKLKQKAKILDQQSEKLWPIGF